MTDEKHHCRIGKVRLKDSGLVIHQYPHSYERTTSAVRSRVIEILEKIDELGEPIMFAGIIVWPDGHTSIGWEYAYEDPVEGCNSRELIRCLDEIIFALRLSNHGY